MYKSFIFPNWFNPKWLNTFEYKNSHKNERRMCMKYRGAVAKCVVTYVIGENYIKHLNSTYIIM